MDQTSYSDYDAFAWFYNRYWSNHPYINQAFPVLEKLLSVYLSPQNCILDLCCGTGQLAQVLIKRGFQVTGLDSSSEMLRYAREKVPSAEFICADARSFSLSPIYHGVLSTFNSLNHIMTLDELTDVFKNVYTALRDGGIFLFDMIMKEGCQQNWHNSFSTVEADNTCIIKGTYDKNKMTSVGDLTLFRLENKIWQRFDVTLFQKSYSESELRSALREAGFRQISAYDAKRDLGMTSHNIGRTFFLANKKSPIDH